MGRVCPFEWVIAGQIAQEKEYNSSCVLNGHPEKLTVQKFEPSRLLKFVDIKSQIFHKFIKFVPCATILNTYSSNRHMRVCLLNNSPF